MVVAPECVVIIPDGNRRYARERGMPDTWGHQQGAKNAERIAKACFDAGAKEFVFWAMSERNVLKRLSLEKAGLRMLLKSAMRGRLKKIRERAPDIDKVAFHLCGPPEMFGQDIELGELAAELTQATSHFTDHSLTLLLEYRGATDIMQASGIVSRMGLEPHKHEQLVRDHMWISHLNKTNVGLIIRTAVRGDKRNSDSLLPIHGEYAQVRDVEEYWPAFSVDRLYSLFAEIEPVTKQLRKGA